MRLTDELIKKKTYMSDDITLDFVDEGDIPHVQELAKVIQYPVSSVGNP